MVKHAKIVLCLVFVFAVLTGCATQKALPVIKAVDLNAKMASGQFGQKANAFEVVFDSTMSMNDAYKSGTKMSQEKALLSLLDETIPNLKMTAAERAFGQFAMFGDATSKLVYGPTDYQKSALPQAVVPLVGNGISPLDTALDGATADLQSQPGQMAVIAFSDGEDTDKFAPVAAAQRLKSAYKDRVCIYTVHLGDSPSGRKMMQQVADEGECGFMVKGDDIASPADMANFVEKIFLQKKPVSITLNIEFDTGKSDIDPKYHDEIKRVGDYMTQFPDTAAVIEGYTDNVDTEASNITLSQNRANSVKNYLVSKFNIGASRLEAIGYGPQKPIASNDTEEGRQKNRRVTAVINNTAK